MKKIIIVLFVSIGFLACKKGDTGPAGAQGSQGIAGPQGVAGNANVTQYTYGAQNLSSAYGQLQVTTTLDTMNQSQWFVYLYYQPLDRWYFVPGYGVGGTTQYRLSMVYISGKVNIHIDRVGSGENYAQARVIRIYASNVTPGGRVSSSTSGVPAIDFTDYKTVRQYYNLSD